jgi:CRP-like cAMP-binding protein
VDAVEKMLHLKALPIFEELSTRQLMNLARTVKEETVQAGDSVVEQGDCDDRLFLVVEGVIHIVRGETLLAEMGPGDFFGEIALFEGIARTATAVAESKVRLLALERTDLLALIEEMPGIAVALIQTLSRRVRDLTDRLMV